MSTTTDPSPAADLPTFIPSRRRKQTHLRRRRTPSPPPATPPLHLPRRPNRRFGLEVSATSHPTPATPLPAPPPDHDSHSVVTRFTHQTGQVTDVDKHMMAYVESHMSARRGGAGAPSTTTPSTTTTTSPSKPSYWAPTRPEARGATLGKLHEVDLGEEAKQRNIQRTAAALTGDPLPAAPPPRGSRRRRNSQDVERDRLVEEVLKETRLDLYTEEAGSGSEVDEEGAADDKIAEKFRKEFIDAILSKRRRRGADPKAKGGKKEDKKRPKGPKLGGSRMARAQMREQQMGAAGAAGAGGVRK